MYWLWWLYGNSLSTVQDRVFPSSPRSHKMSLALGSTFGAMFIALFIDAMWIFWFYRFMYFSILANPQSVWHRHSASFKFHRNSKLSSPRQLLVLQYYCVSVHESDNWLIKKTVNNPVPNSIGIIDTDMLGRSPRVCMLFFSSFCPRSETRLLTTKTCYDSPHRLFLRYGVWTTHRQLWEPLGLGCRTNVRLPSYRCTLAEILT